MSGESQPVDVQPKDVRYPEGGAARSAEIREFDPSPYLRQLRGRGGKTDYLDVRHRLLWLRTEHPDAEIVTELIRSDDQCAVFKAAVSIPNGGSATGHGSETASDFNDYIEKAETKALGRALNALGFGAQFAEGEVEEQRVQAARRGASRSGSPSVVKRESDLESNEQGGLEQFLAETGFESQIALEAALGQPIKGKRPPEIRALLSTMRTPAPTS